MYTQSSLLRTRLRGLEWWHMPLFSSLRRQQSDICESEARLVYIVSSGQPGLCRETLSKKNKIENEVVVSKAWPAWC